MGVDQLGIIDLKPGEWVSPDIPMGKRGMMITPSDLVGERPANEAIIRPATPEEWQRHGITHPLRPQLVEDIKAGLGLEAIAIKWDRPIREVAAKVTSWWARIVRTFPEGEDGQAREVWAQAAAVLSIRERRPPLVPMMPPQPMEMGDAEDEDLDDAPPEQESEEREKPMPRRDEELRRVLTPAKLAQELQENTVFQVARKYSRPETTINSLMKEYGITVRGARRDAEARKVIQATAEDTAEREQPPAPAALQPQRHIGQQGAGAPPTTAAASAPMPKIVAPERDVKLPAGLTIRAGDRLRATVNDQAYAVSDVLTHLKAVEAALITAVGRKVNVILTVEEVAS